jgi:hypothetical protein
MDEAAPQAATGTDSGDDGAKREEREQLGDLVLYLKCRLGRR